MIPTWLTAGHALWVVGLLMWFAFVKVVLGALGMNAEPIYDDRAKLLSPRRPWASSKSGRGSR